MDDVFAMGDPGPSGNENDTYVCDTYIYKVNNLLNSGGICKLLDKILFHNIIFPNTAYSFRGFAGYDGRSVMPVLKQRRIRNASPATQIMIDTYITICSMAFATCRHFVTLNIPRSVRLIGDFVFGPGGGKIVIRD